jgi:hypothetical protein
MIRTILAAALAILGVLFVYGGLRVPAEKLLRLGFGEIGVALIALGELAAGAYFLYCAWELLALKAVTRRRPPS